MFFTGSLQEGIASALQQNKCVFCFVTDEQDESQRWETEYLTEDSIVTLLNDEAVALRLKQGSEEAGFLAAIFPLPNTPTVVIIKNGDLKEYIVNGTNKDEFVRRVTTALRGAQGQPAVPQSVPAATSAPAAQPTDDLYGDAPNNASQTNTSNSSSRGPATPTQEEVNAAAVRDVLAERAARLEAQRLENERKAREARAARAATDDSKEAAQTRNHKEALKKARQEAAEEKARILKKIEDDRAERRAKAAERAALRDQNASPKLGEVAAALTRSESSSLAPSSSAASGMTALQVRLLDGSTIRNRFPSSKTLGDVRKWVDEARTDGNKEPYRFKVVLAPQPSRRIDDTEESKNLADLGLSPSSTLVLAPVGAHVSAYEGSSFGSMLVTFLMLPLSLLQWLWGLISGAFSGLGRARSEEGAAEPVTVREQRKGRFSQFENADDRRGDHQLYNGNSLNFEPRPDEKKDE
ncbi:UBX domain-containing protein [Colletotrichum truncatum]|uniref:UBX domain-containing protein n=1 Tax=Colletotrichum truncatum TaxID=5467 RepID=A0ACC3Z1G7_COLTU|nr:UBX domain-containing protein [Colletotrichum truncatum]KAF6788901.1 UBX domain-containing protein [Colletotrichum truncatum]